MIEETPNLVDRLVDFYGSQVIAFYDPEPRRFFVVRGAASTLDGEALEGAAEKLIYTHELTHALQDQNLDLDRRIKALKDDGDRALALQCLLEGEATLVMIKAALADLPGADESVEDADRAAPVGREPREGERVPKDVPAYFTEQLFFPYAGGDGLRAARGEERRLGGRRPALEEPAAVDAPRSCIRRILPSRPRRTCCPGPRRSRLPRLPASSTPTRWESGACDSFCGAASSTAEADAAAAGWRGDRVAFFAGQTRRDRLRLADLRMDSAAAAGRLEQALAKSRKTNASAAARDDAPRGNGPDGRERDAGAGIAGRSSRRFSR